MSLLLLTLLTLSCKEQEAAAADQLNNVDEVRAPRVIEIDGKAIVTWIDPYAADVQAVVVKDLQTGEAQTIESGVEKAVFEMPQNDASAYQFELKVVNKAQSISLGVIIRLVKNWAQQVHDAIDYHSTATPQQGLFFRNKPASQVNVFDIRKDDNISKLSSAVMQGVINQIQATCYLLWEDQHLNQLVDAGAPHTLVAGATASKNPGFASLYKKYRDQFKYLIVWDENESWSWSLAQMIAAQEKGIPVTATMKDFIEQELGLGSLQVMDIRGRWASKKDAYDWAIAQLAPHCHPTLCFSGGLRSDYKDNPWRLYDYAAASKGFVFWLDETNAADQTIMRSIFDKMNYPVGSSVMGYGMNENGDELNRFTNTHNVGFVVSDYYANGSYWCSFPGKAFQQRQGIAGDVQSGKIYVAISLSDGDNIQFDANSLYQIFKEDAHRGEVPLGVTLAAGLQELNPKLLEFYYQHRTPNEELTAGPSGFQFIYGDQYAQSGQYAEWLQMNSKWLQTAGFHTVHLWNTDEQMYFKQYMENSGVDLVLDGSDRTSTNGSAYKLVNGVVRADQGTHCRAEGDVYRDLMSVSPSPRRPIFHHIYLLTNYYGFEGKKVVLYERLIRELKRAEQDSPNTFEFMLPMDLAASIKEYVANGGIY
ncbi:GxGYxYP family putative glycoside hydrolase [Olivibacter ginsenosidimutans]|uniref:GxGYxYP family putative glycoside hydrolase n=2 Tax=Olivibacter ginsenosidimutans TaxID=1176537 RepID=A0ABP9BQQ2_9SPHI